MAIIELEGLKGLKGLNREDRQAWYERQIEAGKVNDKTPIKQLEILYDNQKYVEKYGLDAFKSKSYEERMQQWKDDIVEDAFYKAYNPFLNDDESSTGPKGVLLDSSKGLGDGWYKYDSMDSDSKIKLLESGYKTPSEMDKMIEERKKALEIAFANTPNSYLMASAYGMIAEPLSESLERGRNDKILERIYNEDLKKKREVLAPLEQKIYEEAVLNLFDDDVASRFMEAIKPKEGPAYIYSAYFNDDGTPSSSETENFSIDDMRHFLAKKYVYDYYLGSEVGYDALNNEGKEYLNKHQAKSTYVGLLMKDIGISALSYTADKWNGLRRMTLAGRTADVYITNDGEVVPTKDVKFDGEQAVYTKDDKTVPVHKENLSLIALDDMGKDGNGEDRVGFNNAQYWTNAEQFGTLDSEEQAQYKKLGFSPYKVVYEPGDESDIIYESLKMTSFALADMASNVLPVLSTTAGANMIAKAGQMANMMSKGMAATGKLLYGTGRISAAVNPTVAAIGIGNAYGRGVYGETYAQNMQQLEQSVYDQAQKSIQNAYNNNPEYKKYFDAKVEETEKELRNTNLSTERLENPAVELRKQAVEKVVQDESRTWADNFKNTKDYGDALQNVAESASDAALASSITTAAKYVGVNYGWRRFLFKNPKKLASSYEKKGIEGVEETVTDTGTKRLTSKFDFSTKKGRWKQVAKTTGAQAWGGAWTNGTDELQSGGGRQINEDRVSQYLQGLYNGKAKEAQYTALDAVASYLHGAVSTLGTENPWRAGLIGGLGSISSGAFNTMNLSQLLTKEGRKQFKEQWKGSNFFGKANMLISNGILNEYYAKKEGQKQLRARVAFINKLLDDTNDFEDLYKALALDMAAVDVTNPEDAAAIQYLKGVQIMDLLHKFNEDKESARTGRQSTVMEKAMTVIQKLSDPSKLTEEEKEDYLSQYYAENSGTPQSEAENENALKVMQERAKKLQASYEIYSDIENTLNKVENKNGRKLPDTVKGRLMQRLALDKFLTDRTAELEEKITGVSGRDPASSETAIESYGTEKAVTERVGAIKNSMKAVDEWIAEAEEKYRKAEKELSDYNDSTEKKDPEKLKKLQTAVDSAKIDTEYLKTMKRDLGLKLDQLFSDGEVKTSDRVLTANEILMLNAQDRARMLDKENYENYSKEQQKEIDKLKNDLTLKDPKLLDDIQNQARLSSKVEANRRSSTLMIENPEAAAYQIESVENREALEASAIRQERWASNNKELLDLWLSKDKENGVPLEETKHAIYKALRILNRGSLEYLKRSDDSTYKSLEKEIDDAIAWSDLVKNINDITENIAGYEKIKKGVDKILDKADSVENVLNELSRIVTDSRVHVNRKIAYNKLLEDLESILNQKAATTKEDREASLEREKKTAKEREERKRKKEEAEKKAKEEAEKKAEEAAKFDIDEKKDADTSNDEAAELALQGLDKEDLTKNNEKSIPKEDIETIKKEAEDVDLGEIDHLESPTVDEQVASVDKAKVAPMPEATSTDEDGAIAESSSDSFLGNMFYGYEVEPLKKDGTLIKRTSRNKNKDISSWLDNNGIRLQEIIDNELDAIKKRDPEVFPLYVTSVKSKDTDFAVQDFMFLAVEYTPEIQGIHDEKLGGTVTANGRQYLIIGMMGFSFNNREQQESYSNLLKEGKRRRKTYMDENPGERFFVDEKIHTKIKDISAGRMVKRLVNDEEIKIRSISELLKDPERNPKGYELEDLSWGIQYGDRFVTVNVPEGSAIYPPKDTGSNVGSVFLLAKSANGNYIPFYIKPVNLNELKDSTFKKQVMAALSELASPDHTVRYEALRKLSQWLYLTNDNININIGTEKDPTVSLIFNGKKTMSFNLNDPAFDSFDMLNKIMELNPRVNITTTVLSDSTLLKMYDEAGAFTTDIAKIGTSNASYNVYAVGTDGKPVITPVTATESPTLEAKSDLARANMKREHSVQIGKEVYREWDGQWHDSTDKVVTDSKLLEQIEYSSKIWSMGLDPVKTIGTDKIFIISNDKDNPVCVIQSKDGKITVIKDKKASLKIISEANSKGAEKSRQKRKKTEVEKDNDDYLKSLDEKEKREIINESEDVDLGISFKEETETRQQDEVLPQTEAQKEAERRVDEITSDASTIELSEDETHYVDASGKKYARVTSVINADEEASSERFDKNSPWSLPSTVVGTGIDVFVRDFFDGKVIDGEDLAKRYPNATTEQLQEFAKQLERLRSDFRRRGLTVVPKGVTVTGTVNVKTKNGTDALDVAGTLDLLAYDRDGNFHIFDMKTNRSAPTGEYGAKKKAKWSKQLSLYKQLLERKYGIVVKGLEIIPIEVSYPVPEGYGNGTTRYTSKDGKLYADGKEYRNAKPVLHDNIPLKEVPISIEYSKLTFDEMSMVKTVRETPAATAAETEKDEAPVVQSGIDKTAESIERADKKSLAELQSDKTLNTFDDVMNSERADEVFDLLTNKFKDFPQDRIDEMTAYLEKKGIAVIGITDIDKWIEMIEECK